MAGRRRGVSRSATRGPKDQSWTTVLADDVVVADAASQAFNILQDSDWKTGSGAERATVLRVRGWLSVYNKTAEAARPAGSWFGYIHLIDEDALSPSAATSITYQDEDILWTGGGSFPAVPATANSVISQLIVDVKSMRKVRSGQDLRLILTNSTGGTMQTSMVLRCLVRRGA